MEIHTNRGVVTGVIGKKPIHLQDRDAKAKDYDAEDLWIDIAAKDKKCSFSTYLDKPYLADLFATFPDGSICTHCVRFPFVPGEKAEVKVMNGSFYVSGTGFYNDWIKADEVIENANKYHTAEETDSILRNYLKEHGNEEGCSLCFIQEGALPSKVLKQLIPQPIFTGRMKDIAELLMVYLRSEERQNK